MSKLALLYAFCLVAGVAMGLSLAIGATGTFVAVAVFYLAIVVTNAAHERRRIG